MYNCLYEFRQSKNLIYDVQFGFRQKQSTFHALIQHTGKIREQLEEENFGCGIFVDLQKNL